MAYLCVNKNGEEKIFDDKPQRDDFYDPRGEAREWIIADFYGADDYGVSIPKGTINKLIGRSLTWEDEPVELK